MAKRKFTTVGGIDELKKRFSERAQLTAGGQGNKLPEAKSDTDVRVMPSQSVGRA